MALEVLVSTDVVGSSGLHPPSQLVMVDIVVEIFVVVIVTFSDEVVISVERLILLVVLVTVILVFGVSTWMIISGVEEPSVPVV